MPKLSIIIPIYNSEKFLKRCLDSVISQTLLDIEIICVNDGSTDKSLDLLDDYAKRDSRIIIINKSNEGLVSARKTGVSVAQSEYVGYVDSDDWIERDMFEKLYNLMTTYNVDIVSSGYIFEGDYQSLYCDSVEKGYYGINKINDLRNCSIIDMKNKNVGVRGAVWCKIFKRKLIQKVQNNIPNEISYSEDKLCIISYLLECKSAYITKDAWYHYMKNQNSMVNSSNTNYLNSVNEVYKYFLKLYEHDNFTEDMIKQAELYIVELLYKGINSRLGFHNKNLLWLKPYYLQSIPAGSQIILCGGGELGEAYLTQLRSRRDIEIIAVTDTKLNIENFFSRENNADQNKHCLADIDICEYDYILITVKNRTKSDEIKERLLSQGIEERKILWFEQSEMYWDFAEANGWLQTGSKYKL